MVLIDLGCGTAPHPNTSVGIDSRHPINSPAQDATVTPWTQTHGTTIASESVDAVHSSHFFEHVPKGQPLIDVMAECFRVLKTGGTLTIICPLVGWTNSNGEGQAVQGWQPFADPTHVNYLWFPESLLYFSTDGNWRPCADYGMPAFTVGGYIEEHQTSALLKDPWGKTPFWSVRSGWEGLARMVKP